MCIVIDINALAMVFDDNHADHANFSSVKKWIEARCGFVVFGGTKYKRELALAGRYMRLIRILKDAGKAISISDEAVDKIEIDVRKKVKGNKCDDQHIIALLGAARCTLLCSVDARSFQFVKDRTLYPKGAPIVRIYSSNINKKLLKRADPNKLSHVDV